MTHHILFMINECCIYIISTSDINRVYVYVCVCYLFTYTCKQELLTFKYCIVDWKSATDCIGRKKIMFFQPNGINQASVCCEMRNKYTL